MLFKQSTVGRLQRVLRALGRDSTQEGIVSARFRRLSMVSPRVSPETVAIVNPNLRETLKLAHVKYHSGILKSSFRLNFGGSLPGTVHQRSRRGRCDTWRFTAPAGDRSLPSVLRKRIPTCITGDERAPPSPSACPQIVLFCLLRLRNRDGCGNPAARRVRAGRATRRRARSR